jgi:hypothetical protein
MKNKTDAAKVKPTRSAKLGGQPENDADAREAGVSSATDKTAPDKKKN